MHSESSVSSVPGRASDANQQVNAQAMGRGSDFPMRFVGVFPQFSHVAQHGHPPPGAREI